VAASGGLAAAVPHTGECPLVTGLVALIVHQRAGLPELRRSWLSLGAARIGTAAVTVLR
jgi:hypothetical protein